MAKKPEDTGVQNPAPATEMDSASGAMIEPAIKQSVDLGHPAIDDNPREGTSAEQNKRDMNDPQKRKPNDEDYVGQGLDPAPYGKAAKK
ncbi:MAG TPA: hypothetical protein VFT89_07370 [Rhizobiaceae bacterium]|nr:hypothetical protein [Rhizobiaceae bacterium]